MGEIETNERLVRLETKMDVIISQQNTHREVEKTAETALSIARENRDRINRTQTVVNGVTITVIAGIIMQVILLLGGK